MDSQKTLSIIIPTYNMENYLTRCLDSLVNAKEVLPKLEILVVNDGSKDKSSRIAHEYQKKHPDSIVVIDKENGNYGSCVNRGLKEATGKYVKVLDADDWFLTENLKRFTDILAFRDEDLVLTDFDVVDTQGGVIESVRHGYPKGQTLCMDSFCGTKEFCKMQMHSVTYKTAMVKGIGYQQSEGISYTDQEWIFEPMSHAKSFYNTGLIIYQYLMGREGQTMNPEQMRKQIGHTLQGVYVMMAAYERRAVECSSSMKRYLLSKLKERLLYLYRAFLLEQVSGRELILRLDDAIEQRHMEIYLMSNNIFPDKLFPFHFVRWWRTHGRENLPQWVKALYKILIYLKKIAKA